jgi:hypothetical protein
MTFWRSCYHTEKYYMLKISALVGQKCREMQIMRG